MAHMGAMPVTPEGFTVWGVGLTGVIKGDLPLNCRQLGVDVNLISAGPIIIAIVLDHTDTITTSLGQSPTQ